MQRPAVAGLRIDLDDRRCGVTSDASGRCSRIAFVESRSRIDGPLSGLLRSRCQSNPLFDLSTAEARREAERLRAAPLAHLDRPVLVVAGWRAWRIAPAMLARRLRSLTGAPRRQFGAYSYAACSDFDSAAQGLVRAAARLTGREPGDDPGEVDVVAVSMGGLLARYAATERRDQRETPLPRLRIGRLFTLATPHRGAKLAGLVHVDAASRDMRAGSEFLRTLDGQLVDADYELVCYARLGDAWVGATRTAPRGFAPIWVNEPPLTLSHLLVGSDLRIAVDIARRLRGEDPIAIGGSMPPID